MLKTELISRGGSVAPTESDMARIDGGGDQIYWGCRKSGDHDGITRNTAERVAGYLDSYSIVIGRALNQSLVCEGI